MGAHGSITCPSCGQPVEIGTPTCGNCGNDMSAYMGPMQESMQQQQQQMDTGQMGSGQMGTTNVIAEPVPWRRLVLAISIVGIGLIVFFARGPIEDAINSVDQARDAINNIDIDVSIPEITIPDLDELLEDQGLNSQPIAGGYTRVPQVVKELRKGGFSCTQVDVQVATPPVASGSCQHKGLHTQINIYMDQTTFTFARNEIYVDDFPIPFLRNKNAYVASIVSVVREAKRAIGGQLHIPPE